MNISEPQAEPLPQPETVINEQTLTDYTTAITGVVEASRAKVVTVEAQVMEATRTASGVIVSVSGSQAYIFVPAETITGAAEVSVRFVNGISLKAEIVGEDSETGLGLLKADVPFAVGAFTAGDADLLGQGEYIIAMGGRRMTTMSSMISFGVVAEAGQRRMSASDLWLTDIIETDAVVTTDNIGGALLDVGGELMGMLIRMPYGGQEKMGYAVSVNEMKRVYRQLTENGTVARGRLGLVCMAVEKLQTYEKSSLNLPLSLRSGLLVTNVHSDVSGVVSGDVLISVDGTTLHTPQDLKDQLYRHAGGDTVRLRIYHDGEYYENEVVLQ